MNVMIRLAGFVLAASSALALQTTPAISQTALVYCPAGISAGNSAKCTQIQNALTGYTVTVTNTMDLSTADLRGYNVFIIPSTMPYAALEAQGASANLRRYLTGRVAVYSGAPDQGPTANLASKQAIIRGLANWAKHDNGTGLVVLQDATGNYAWLNGIAGVSVAEDAGNNQRMYDQVSRKTTIGTTILGTADFKDMAASGLVSATGTGLSLDARGFQGQERGVVLVTFTRIPTPLDQNQTITFNAPSGLKYGDADVDLGATASSKLPVSYSSGTTSVCTIVADKLHIVAAGDCTVTASQPGGSGYSPAPDVTHTFGIAKAAQTIGFNEIGDKVYGDGPFALVASASSGLALYFETSGPCSVAGGFATIFGAGSCTITAKQDGDGNFSAAKPQSRAFTIAKADQTIAFDDLPGRTYGDADFTVSATATSALPVTFTASGSCKVSGATISITGAGDCTITASQAGNGNFNAAPGVPRSFPIAQKGATVTLGNLSHDYDGVAKPATATTDPAGLGVSITYDGSTTVPTNAGSYAVSAVITDANHTGSAKGTLVIRKAGQSITFNKPDDRKFGDAPFDLSATATSGLTVAFTATGKCTLSGITLSLDGAGNCTVTALQGGDNNYEVAESVAHTFSIAKKSTSITLGALSFTYNGQQQGTTATTPDLGTAGISITYNGSAQAPTNAGSYAVKASLSHADYEADDVGGTLVIDRKPATVTVGSTSRVYGEANPTAFEITAPEGFLNSETPACSFTLAETATPAAKAGSTHEISANCTHDNYSISVKPGTLTITKAPISVTAANASRAYGDANPTFTGSIGGIKNGDAITASYSSTADERSGVGAYDIVPALSGDALSNYQTPVVTNGTLTVSARPITVTADAKTKVYGEADPALTHQVTSGSLVNGDLLTGSLSRASGETVLGGPYAIGQGTLMATNNYAVTFVGASLTITAKPVTGGFSAADKEYDGSPAAEATPHTLTGKVGNDDVRLEVSNAQFDSKDAGTNKSVTADLALAGTASGNYSLNNPRETATASITPRPITVTAHSKTKVYGEVDPPLTHEITSEKKLVSGDAFSGSLMRAQGKNVGMYTIDKGSLSAGGNYEIKFEGATFTITPRALNISATGVNKEYDGNTSATATLTDDRVSDDALTTAYASASFADPNAGDGKPVSVSGITLTGADAGNYTFNASATTTANITKATLAVWANDASRPFGAENPPFTGGYSGQKNGEAFALTFSTTAQSGSLVGTYDIVPKAGGPTAGNYNMAVTNGKLSIGAWKVEGFHNPVTKSTSIVLTPGADGKAATPPVVDNATIWNSAKGGSTIPLKFTVFAGTSEVTSTDGIKLTMTKLSCAVGAGEDAVEPDLLGNTGATDLRYTGGQFIQNWKTPAAKTDECYRVAATLRDNSAIYTFVKLKK